MASMSTSELRGVTNIAAATGAANGVVTATLAAPGVGLRWKITQAVASFTGAAPSVPIACTITVGPTAFIVGIDSGLQLPFVNPINGSDNGTAVISLAAGGASVVGQVAIMGYVEAVTTL